MYVDLMVVVRLILLQIEEAVVVVTGITTLATCLEILLISDHEGAVDFVLGPSCLVEVTPTTLSACEDHLAVRATSHCLQFEPFGD